MKTKHCVAVICLLILSSCSEKNGPLAIFKKMSPHDQYGQRLKDAGLDKTAMGSEWLRKADESVGKALLINVPYKETGYFPADKVVCSAYRFEMKRGEALHVTISKKPATKFNIYPDILQVQANGQADVVASADTNGAAINYEIKKGGTYILRLQPELLRGGEYTLTVTKAPSLAFPVAASGKPYIGSFFGDSRDEGGRKHEGIDIFAPKGTPALAAANGKITRVGENKLGGLVVLLNPEGTDYELYYAHLGVQLVHEGQVVHVGDTVGLTDNTGNAKNTPSHLHFGIYTDGGAIDPLVFVQKDTKSPAEITAPLDNLNLLVRTKVKAELHGSGEDRSALNTIAIYTPVTVEAAAKDQYKVLLPDGREGFIAGRDVTPLNTMRTVTLSAPLPLYDAPDSSSAARKSLLDAGTRVNIRGVYKNYYFVDHSDTSGWITIQN